ncbi:hypothetical protein BH11MYX2_BH11MYX2_15380 [soil metagenome]
MAVLLALLLPTAAHAEQSKKDRERAAKTTSTGRVPTVGTKPTRLTNLYNQWTNEWISVAPGETVPPELANRFLRDHYTSSSTQMEPKLLPTVLAAAAHFHSDTALIVSGFRHPKFNLILRKKGHQVARDSQHTHGNAIDFRIPRVTTQALHKWAKDQHMGGVGLYLDSGFVHMDTGPVRYWNGE